MGQQLSLHSQAVATAELVAAYCWLGKTWAKMLQKHRVHKLRKTWWTVGKILPPSKICEKLAVDWCRFLTALQAFWVSREPPGNTSSSPVPALSALKFIWEAEAYKVETLGTAEEHAEVLALCIVATETRWGFLHEVPLLATYLEINSDLKFSKDIYLKKKKNS